jgi:hypothetical protein
MLSCIKAKKTLPNPKLKINPEVAPKKIDSNIFYEK